MANWSSSWLTFTGEEANVEKARMMFKEMSDKEVQTNLGQIPDFIKEENTDGWFHQIMVDETDIISFEAKWEPPIQTLKVIGKEMKVDFTLDYEELGNGLFGKAVYNHKEDELKTYILTKEDFDQYTTDEETSTHTYNGQEYESEYEILELIFEKKHGFAY